MRESKNYTQCPPVGTTRPKNGLREAEGKITFFSSLSSRYLILFYLCSFSTWPSRLPLFSALCNPVFPRSTELHTAFGCHAALLSRTLRRLLAFLPTSLLPPAKSQITHAEDFYSATAAVIGKWGKNPMVRWNIGEPWRAAVYRVCKKYVYVHDSEKAHFRYTLTSQAPGTSSEKKIISLVKMDPARGERLICATYMYTNAAGTLHYVIFHPKQTWC